MLLQAFAKLQTGGNTTSNSSKWGYLNISSVEHIPQTSIDAVVLRSVFRAELVVVLNLTRYFDTHKRPFNLSYRRKVIRVHRPNHTDKCQYRQTENSRLKYGIELWKAFCPWFFANHFLSSSDKKGDSREVDITGVTTLQLVNEEIYRFGIMIS